tara:strand:- start:216 stop:401 length:186 start_codon:yes stop_codon:yes gene_type:complete
MKIRTHITIPVFCHEDDQGRIILDNEYMREYFDEQLSRLYLETKLGQEESFNKNKLKKQNK